MPFPNIFIQSPILQTESNAFRKLIKQQYSFLFFAFSNSISAYKEKIWSNVEYPALNPAWFSFKISYEVR